MYPNQVNLIPLQQTASDILGLEYNEVKPQLKLPSTIKKKKVGIGFHSTAQAKYWNNPNGWQEVVDYLQHEAVSLFLVLQHPLILVENFLMME